MAALIDAWLPEYDHREYHEVVVAAGPRRTYDAVKRADLTKSPTVRALFVLRGMVGQRGTIADLTGGGFTMLEERPGDEFVLGIVGAFWKPTGKLQRLTPEAFRGFSRSGFAKGVWNFRIEAIDASTTRLSTETRVRSIDIESRKRFARYWRLIAPFSGYIRRQMLATIKHDAESA